MPLTQKPEIKALRREASSVERQLSFQKAFGLRQRPAPRQALMCQDSLVGLGVPERTSGEAHHYGIATEELRYSYAGDAYSASDNSNLTVRDRQAGCLKSVTSNTPVRSSHTSSSRQAAHPTATGWDEELQARTACARLPWQGHFESLASESFRTDPSVCPISEIPYLNSWSRLVLISSLEKCLDSFQVSENYILFAKLCENPVVS